MKEKQRKKAVLEKNINESHRFKKADEHIYIPHKWWEREQDTEMTVYMRRFH